MGGDISKQFMLWNEKPILLYTIQKFIDSPVDFKKIIVVIPPDSKEYCQEVLFDSEEIISKKVTLEEGGKERQDSVYKGLLQMDQEIEIVCIHDGVRPFVTPDLISAAVKEADYNGAVIPVLPLKDTLIEINKDGTLIQTVDREKYKLVQTPQCFRKNIIMKAYEQAFRENFYATDDAALVRNMGKTVKTITGELMNIKLTTPEDLLWAKLIHNQRNEGE